ncbi:MAG: hypothetical protein ACR2RB_15995 [Gammaproteobacteria bacterium]
MAKHSRDDLADAAEKIWNDSEDDTDHVRWRKVVGRLSVMMAQNVLSDASNLQDRMRGEGD